MIRRELTVFLLVGVTTVLVDYASYTLLGVCGAQLDVAKAAGFLIGTVFAYFANRHWTFGHREAASGSVVRFALLYGVTLAANVLVNAWFLKVLAGQSWGRQGAFVVATGTSAVLNFLGMKFLVFRQSSPLSKFPT
ncbi:GtrA family protein [Aquabacterium sp.]|uniref:GtrA family protein n=1 Tax=Aquabacterium sp. TaxID=1872578 RepID=UPI0035B1CD0F